MRLEGDRGTREEGNRLFFEVCWDGKYSLALDSRMVVCTGGATVLLSMRRDDIKK